MKYDYSKYECPYSHLEKECGHELKSPEGYEGTHSVWCACGFRSPVFYLDPEQLGFKKKGETSTPTNEGAKTAEEIAVSKYPILSSDTNEDNLIQLMKQSGFIDGFNLSNQQLAEKDKEIANLEMQLLSANNLLKATKSEMPRDEEIEAEHKRRERIKVVDNKLLNYSPQTFEEGAKWMRSKFPQSDGQRYGEILEWIAKNKFNENGGWYRKMVNYDDLKKFIQSLQSKEQEPKQDGQRYSEEDKFMLQKIRRYFLSKGALPFEKDACLFIDKLFQSLQSKKQEPKQDGQRYGEEELKTIATKSFQDSDLKTWNKRFKDAMVIQFINGYKLSLQSKEQEPKGSEECICSFSSINILCPLHGGE